MDELRRDHEKGLKAEAVACVRSVGREMAEVDGVIVVGYSESLCILIWPRNSHP